MGSAEAARIAGKAEASNAITIIVRTAPEYENGSIALTPNRKEPTSCDAASEPATPRPHPTNASLPPEASTSCAMLVR